jgi:hypothetical protein
MALFVTSQTDHTVREYNSTTGAFVKVAASGGALGDPLDVVIGLDGNLLVSDGQTNQVKRYNRSTGAFTNVFASTNLSGPLGMTIHQGTLYVTNSNPPQGVQSFDAVSGANTGNFVPSLANPSPRDVKVNPANNRLYVLYYNAATVETFNLATKASFGLLMPSGSGGLRTPQAMAFGPTVTSISQAVSGMLASDATIQQRGHSSTCLPTPAASTLAGSRSVPTITSMPPLKTVPR